jgi:hypothetical protein
VAGDEGEEVNPAGGMLGCTATGSGHARPYPLLLTRGGSGSALDLAGVERTRELREDRGEGRAMPTHRRPLSPRPPPDTVITRERGRGRCCSVEREIEQESAGGC